MIDLINLPIPPERTRPTGRECAGVQIRDNDAATLARNPGHFADRVLRTRHVGEGEGTEREIHRTIRYRNPAGLRETEAPGEARFARCFEKHLRAEIHAKNLRAALLGQSHPAASAARNVQEARGTQRG